MIAILMMMMMMTHLSFNKRIIKMKISQKIKTLMMMIL